MNVYPEQFELKCPYVLPKIKMLKKLLSIHVIHIWDRLVHECNLHSIVIKQVCSNKVASEGRDKGKVAERYLPGCLL